MRTHSLILAAAFACLLIISAGCGSGDRVQTYPVDGSVFVDGKPAAGARLIFHPQQEDPTVIPTAKVTADGSYQATTYDVFDGAPPGNYEVTLTWPTPKPPGAAVDEPEGPDRLNGRYAKAKDSPWKITVRAGNNTLQPIRIQLDSKKN